MPASAIPYANLLISEDDFREVQTAVRELRATGPYSDYLTGVIRALEWIAGEDVIFDGRMVVPAPPISEEYFGATPETIDAEMVVAMARMNERPRYTRGVVNTFVWARHGGLSPLLVD